MVVPQGRRLVVRIDDVAGKAIVARLLDARDGTPVDARSGEGVRAWTGRFPADRDLRIVVTRRAGNGPALGYLLAVALK